MEAIKLYEYSSCINNFEAWININDLEIDQNRIVTSEYLEKLGFERFKKHLLKNCSFINTVEYFWGAMAVFKMLDKCDEEQVVKEMLDFLIKSDYQEFKDNILALGDTSVPKCLIRELNNIK